MYLDTLSNRLDLPLVLNALGLHGEGAEIGVYKGDFALALLDRWAGRTLYLVDPWDGADDYLDSWNLGPQGMESLYQETLSRILPHRDRVKVLRATSSCAAGTFRDNQLDFVYIDANHGYAHVLEDLHLWFRIVHVGGLVMGHDYFNAHADEDCEPVSLPADSMPMDPNTLTSYGVKAAVDHFAKLIGAELQFTTEPLPTWYFRKTEFQQMRYAAIMTSHSRHYHKP